MRKLFAIGFLFCSLPAAAQITDPAIEVGYGLTQSKNRSGGALNAQASVSLFNIQDLQLRGELFYQEGSNGGASKCERLDLAYCIGTTDLNRIGAASATLHVPLRSGQRFSAYVPLGVGLYHRQTRTTESEGPIQICVTGSSIEPCAGQPPFGTLTYTTKTTVPGYNFGIGFSGKVARANLYLELRGHDMLERGVSTGAVPVSVGVRF